MAKSKSSPEAVVMAFFWTQPIEAANRALANGKLAIRHREEEIKNAPKVRVPGPPAVGTPGGAKKKSHHAAKPAAPQPIKPKGKPGPKPKVKPEPIGLTAAVNANPSANDPANLFPADGSQPPEPAPVNLSGASS